MTFDFIVYRDPIHYSSKPLIRVGRVEDSSSPTAGSIALMPVSSILADLSAIPGAIAIVVWSFFVLPWLPTLITVAAGFIDFVGGAEPAAFVEEVPFGTICSFDPVGSSVQIASAVCVLFGSPPYEVWMMGRERAAITSFDGNAQLSTCGIQCGKNWLGPGSGTD